MKQFKTLKIHDDFPHKVNKDKPSSKDVFGNQTKH